MIFKSNKQASWLKHNKPEVYYGKLKQARKTDNYFRKANRLSRRKSRSVNVRRNHRHV